MIQCPQCLTQVASLADRLGHKMDCSEPSRRGTVEEPKYPMAEVHLSTGHDGNIGAVMGSVREALRRAGARDDEASKIWGEIFASESYDESLQIVMRWVNVT